MSNDMLKNIRVINHELMLACEALQDQVDLANEPYAMTREECEEEVGDRPIIVSVGAGKTQAEGLLIERRLAVMCSRALDNIEDARMREARTRGELRAFTEEGLRLRAAQPTEHEIGCGDFPMAKSLEQLESEVVGRGRHIKESGF